jgi:hypothetical protein
MAKLSPDFVSSISDMLDKAERLKDEPVWLAHAGTHANGEPIYMIIAMGAGARALDKALKSVAKLDPRSPDTQTGM